VFVVVKMALFGAALALDETVRPVVSLSRFLRQMVLIVVMAQVGVLVLVLAAERPALLLLALGPMLAAYLLLRSETRAVLDRDDAERTARREAELRAQGGDLLAADAKVATGARFELRLPLRDPASRLLPSAAEDRVTPLRVVPGPAHGSS
jgi:hypothetical protein